MASGLITGLMVTFGRLPGIFSMKGLFGKLHVR